MAEKTVDIPTRGTTSGMEGTRSQERYTSPPVNIYETQRGLVLVADLPGVSKENLDVRVKDDVLTIQGKSNHVAPGDVTYREYELSNFFRQFELGEQVDQARINAELKHGVLTLQLPKVEKPKPRHIEVKVN